MRDVLLGFFAALAILLGALLYLAHEENEELREAHDQLVERFFPEEVSAEKAALIAARRKR